MQNELIIRKKFFLIIASSLLILVFYFFLFSFDKSTKIIFCDVGQGDATYIRVKNQVDVLIDAGPDRKVLTCLGKYMPFWDRKIELAIISHPQKDHFGGFLYLLDRYQIEKIIMTPVDNPSLSFKNFKENIATKKIPVVFPDDNTRLKILNTSIDFIWPSREFIAKNLFYPKSQLTNNPIISKTNLLGSGTIDDNNFSLVFLYEEKDFKALFTAI